MQLRGLASAPLRHSLRWAPVVEIDGDTYHSARTAADAARDRKLVRADYTVLRIPASLVERDLSRAVEIVRVALGRAQVG